MTPPRASDGFLTIFQAAVRLAEALAVDAILLLLDEPVDWQQVKDSSRGQNILLAADRGSAVEGASLVGLASVILADALDIEVHEKLSQALLNAVADELLASGRA